MSRGDSGPLRLRHRVAARIRRWELFGAGDHVAVAVSGGLDSVVLLDLLVVLADLHGAELSVVTVDHGTRPESAADVDFVREQAASHALRCDVFRAEMGEGASEAACRRARYHAFADVDADRIALAHHRDDQAETVLLQLLRGAGSAGLSGMTWRRERYVRPLLDTSRTELRAWAEARSLSWREDPSNDDPGYTRNRVRHEVMPLLEDIRSGAAATLARSARLLSIEDAFLDELVEADPRCTPPWKQDFVAAAPEALVRRALVTALPKCTAAHIDAIRQAARRGRGRVELGDGHVIVVASGVVRLTRESPNS